MDINHIINNDNEKPLDRIVENGGFTRIFRTIACIGDSLSSGEFETVKPNGDRGYHDFYEYSWGQILGRACGSTVYNFSTGGLKAEDFITWFGDSKGFWKTKYAADAYIIALGVNDVMNCGQEIGAVGDEDNEESKTFAHYYGMIIKRYKEIQPRARFFLMTMCYELEEECHRKVREEVRDVLEGFAEKYEGTYVIDLLRYGPEYNGELRKRIFMGSHLNAAGYVLTADIVGSYIDWIIRHNMEDFADVGLIGTDLNGCGK